MNQHQEMVNILSDRIAKLYIELAAAESAAKHWKQQFEETKAELDGYLEKTKEPG